METADYLRELFWLRSVESRCSVCFEKKLYRILEMKRSEYMVKMELRGAEPSELQQGSTKAPMKKKTLSGRGSLLFRACCV